MFLLSALDRLFVQELLAIAQGGDSKAGGDDRVILAHSGIAVCPTAILALLRRHNVNNRAGDSLAILGGE